MGRLIDADALKEELEFLKYIIPSDLSRLLNSEINRCIEVIDNAPTVAEDYDTGYQDGVEDGLNDIRPHGKWITIDVFVVKCSVCGVESFATPFCPRCGASMDMRGENHE